VQAFIILFYVKCPVFKRVCDIIITPVSKVASPTCMGDYCPSLSSPSFPTILEKLLLEKYSPLSTSPHHTPRLSTLLSVFLIPLRPLPLSQLRRPFRLPPMVRHQFWSLSSTTSIPFFATNNYVHNRTFIGQPCGKRTAYKISCERKKINR